MKVSQLVTGVPDAATHPCAQPAGAFGAEPVPGERRTVQIRGEPASRRMTDRDVMAHNREVTP